MRALSLGAVALAVVVASWSSPASAHDFWIEPSMFEAEVPASVSLRLRVGERFSGRAVRRNSGAIARFVASGPTGETDVPGLEGRDPAGLLRIDEPGAYVVGYETVGQAIELAADSFEKYLVEEGLEHVIETRRGAGQSERPGREVFYRCAKSLVRAGEPPSPSGFRDRALGLTLELVLEPGLDAAGSDSGRPARLLFHGEPIEDVLVVGRVRGQDEPTIRARTNAEGRVMLPAVDGEWLVKAVHMVPARDDPRADWKSYWASTTFSAGDRAGQP